MEIKNRHILSNKDKRNLLSELKSLYGEGSSSFISKSDIIEQVKTDQYLTYIKDKKIWLFYYQLNDKEILLPSIHCIRESGFKLPAIVVDKGAIKFILNGADVMAPGVVSFESGIEEGDIVTIHEETANSILGIGSALVTPEKFAKSKKGKVVHTIHYLKDIIWEFQI